MLKRLVVVAGIVSAVLASGVSAQAERRVALVIGNSAYKHATTLRNPGNDANDVAEILKKVGFDVHLGLDLDQQGFARTIEQFASSLDDADVGLFFYAGHGLQMNDKNYLVSVNAKLESQFLLSSETIELDAVVRLMESKVPVNLVFLDACRNNPLAENLRRSLASLKRAALIGRGLARMEPTGRDTLVAFAAAPGQEAGDGGGERNSPFTAALLKHLPTPGLEVSVMLKEVAADVRRETRNNQRPQQLSDMTKTFYFAKLDASAPARVEAPAAPPRASATPADDRAYDFAFWNSVQATGDCDAIRAYMVRFPQGAFLELARLAERRVCAPNRRVTVVAEPTAPHAAAQDPPPPIAAAPAAAAPPEPSITARPADPPSVANLLAALPKAEPTPSPVPSVADGKLARNIQKELIRLGCAKGDADDAWDSDAQDAVRKFNRYAKARLDAKTPSRDMMAALRGYDKRVCPLECGPGTRARAGVCVAVDRAVTSASRQAEPRQRTRKASESRRASAQQPEPGRPPHPPHFGHHPHPPPGFRHPPPGFGHPPPHPPPRPMVRTD